MPTTRATQPVKGSSQDKCGGKASCHANDAFLDVIWIWVFFHFSTFSLCHNIRATHAPLHSNPEAAVAFYRDARPLSFFRPEYGDGEVGGGRGRDFNGGRRARARASVSASGEEKQSFTVDANLKFQNPFCLPSLQTAAARRLLPPSRHFSTVRDCSSAQRATAGN